MSLAETTPQPDLPVLRDRVTERFAELRRRLRGQLAVEALARVLGLVVAMAVLSLVLDWRLELSLAARAAFSAVVVVVAGVVAWRYLIGPLRLDLGPIELAAALDEARHPQARAALTPRVATVLELPGQEAGRVHASGAMIDRAVRRSFASLEEVDLRERINRRHLRWSVTALCGVLLVPVVLAAVLPGGTARWARRWLLGSSEPWPRNTTIRVLGVVGDRLIVPRGEPAVLRVAVEDKRRPTDSVWMKVYPAEGRRLTKTLTRFGPGDFRYDLDPLQAPWTVRLYGGDGRAGPVIIEPVDRPRIAELELISRHPWDEKPQRHLFTGEEGNIQLLPKTEAELRLAANVPIAEVRVTAEGPGVGPFERTDDRTFVARWTHEKPVELRVELVSARADLVSHPRPIGIGLKADRPPRVSLRHEGVRQRVTAVAKVPLEVVVRDDFGVRSTELATRIDRAERSSAEEKPETPQPPEEQTAVLYGPEDPAVETSVTRGHTLELQARRVAPGDLIHVTGRGEDNCYTGFQKAESRTVVFRVVGAEELFREILLRQQEARARFRKAEEQAEELDRAMATAELPQDAPDLLRRHRLVQREVWQVRRNLEESAEEMRLNQLGGQEADELIRRNVLEPMGRLHDHLMTRQRQALESMSQGEPRQPDEVTGRQREIVDAMKGLLKNMAQWDSFIDVVNQLNAIIKIEEEVRRDTDRLREGEVETIFEK